MRHRYDTGFTLLETLVALLILGVALSAAFRALGATTASANSLQIRQMGEWIAANRLAELRVAGAFPDIGHSEGVAALGERHFRWHEEIRETPNPLFRRVDVSVFASGEEQSAIARLSGFVARPLQ